MRALAIGRAAASEGDVRRVRGDRKGLVRGSLSAAGEEISGAPRIPALSQELCRGLKRGPRQRSGREMKRRRVAARDLHRAIIVSACRGRRCAGRNGEDRGRPGVATVRFLTIARLVITSR